MGARSSEARVAALALALLLPATANAFPGSVRWGYANCATCHFNLTGGGVLTPYGRQLSRELLSTWGGEREANFAFGRIPTPDWLSLGGDFCGFVTTRRTPTPRGMSSTLQVLEADLEAAATRGPFLAVATVGLKPSENAAVQGWTSRRHFLQYNFTPGLSLRAGRFLPNYGIWNGDVSVATRAGLGWDSMSSSDNVEMNLIGQRFNVSATGILGQRDLPAPQRSSGVAATARLFFADKRRVGLSFMATRSELLDRRALGIHGVIGIGKHAYLLSETDLARLRPRADPARARWDLLSNWCFARETIKGLYVLLVEELVTRDLGGSEGGTNHSYGVALRWFPSSHFEMQLRWRQQHADAVSPPYLDGVSALFRFYP